MQNGPIYLNQSVGQSGSKLENFWFWSQIVTFAIFVQSHLYNQQEGIKEDYNSVHFKSR